MFSVDPTYKTRVYILSKNLKNCIFYILATIFFFSFLPQKVKLLKLIPTVSRLI